MRIAFARRVGIAALLAGALLMAWIVPLAAHGPGVLEACVKRSNGDMRLVHPGDACRHNEKRVIIPLPRSFLHP